MALFEFAICLQKRNASFGTNSAINKQLKVLVTAFSQLTAVLPQNEEGEIVSKKDLNQSWGEQIVLALENITSALVTYELVIVVNAELKQAINKQLLAIKRLKEAESKETVRKEGNIFSLTLGTFTLRTRLIQEQ